MKSTAPIVLALSVLLLNTLPTNATEVHVVVHNSNSDEIDIKEISKIFLGKAKSFPNGSSAIPINQPENSKITSAFNREVLNKSSSQLKAYWSKLVFTGKGTPPRSVDSDTEVLELVTNNPNLIGFVSSASLNDNVKVIASFKM